ncbi:hypothetical protein MCC93_21710 [Morococcus cerebrosus]|uniref:Uncharacterized protein n=1 Tax=Morococcus cerebrosus TaxID=1056807 RepID=A0A0C1E3M3_9NEIS|nr:hypothetical protein MCC93_21710 [Morococcus cerebrosus]
MFAINEVSFYFSDDLLPNPNKSIHSIYSPSKYHPCKQQSVQSVKMGRLKFV